MVALPLVLALLASGDVIYGQAGTGGAANVQSPAERIEVIDFDIRGVHAIDESALRKALQTQATSWLPWAKRRYFNAETFLQDLKRIETFYAERGYPHARVIESAVDKRDKGVVLRVVVDEGRPQRVAGISYSGIEAIADSTLRKLRDAAPLKEGAPFDADAVKQTAQMLMSALGDIGYAYPRVEVRQTPAEPGLVSAEFHAEPGALGYFGPIQITGNSNIEDDVIRREVAYLPGQPFRAELLRETQHRLGLLGLFESVLVEVAEPDQPAVEVPTRITVKETDIRKFAYSFGYGTEEQLSAEAQWRHLNLFGGGRAGTIRGRWSSIDRGGEASFRHPYLFTSKLSLQVAAYAWDFDEPVYSALSLGGSGSLSYAIGRLNRVTATYLQQFERNQIAVDAVSADSPSLLTTLGLSPTDASQDGMLSAVRFDAARETTPARARAESLSPRGGYRAAGRVEHAGGWLPGSFNYDNVFTTGSYYQPVGAVVLAGRLQFGSIVSERVTGLPFSKRYFLGGADSLRGWGRFEVSPLSANGQPIGGRTVLLVNGEVRVPIVGPLSGVVFVDAGNVWADSWAPHLDDLRSNTGAGIRVNSPFGLFRLDAGYQLTPIDGLRVDGERPDRRWRIHVSLGHVF
jgi:outer membrane protein assembly complex protein YaeT